ncbi:phosphoglycerate mutase [Candidatus Protofrankia californiensis]|uniref:Phosphoglycerate mutase n=1 Tax=Candidatus Protofrankia californiensis TaxID=1839754 RepID=A0A1C3P3D4_9ACTN|nr:phosphoglycerate mutase [Candidatus Protofrankia californiensis]
MAVITTLILTRHGEAHCNVARIAGGDRACTGLTERGRQQVELLARRLRAEEPCDVLYTTSRRRTQESARILSDALDLPIHVERDLTGPHHGDADGRPWDEIKAAFGGPPQSDPDRPYTLGAETWNQYLTRASAALAAVIQRHHGQRILISGHGETTDAAALLLLSLAPGFCTRIGFETSHAALTRWHMHRNRLGQELWILAALNDTGHLTGAP